MKKHTVGILILAVSVIGLMSGCGANKDENLDSFKPITGEQEREIENFMSDENTEITENEDGTKTYKSQDGAIEGGGVR